MLIIDWMKADVVSISPDTSLLQCKRLFKEHKVSRLPVVDTDGVLVGLLALSDLASMTPQNATPLEILEAIDILGETKAKQVMTVAPPTISYKSTVDKAALRMIENDLNCLPVVDSDEKLVGILTEWDMFKALADVTGAAHRGVDMAFVLEDTRGTLRDILDQLKEDSMRIVSVLTSFSSEGMKQVKIRFHHEDPTAEEASLERLKSHPCLRYWARGEEMGLCNTETITRHV